jgi:glycosyltransferase involved in cell wall biosynthesis
MISPGVTRDVSRLGSRAAEVVAETKAARVLLLISASDYQSAVIKGVASMLAEFDEGGFFDRVLVAFPFARTSTRVNISERVAVRDIGIDWLPLARKSRRLRRVAAPLHVLRSVVELARLARRENVSVVRATDPCFSGLIGWAVARLSARPFCVSIHADFDKRHRLGGTSAGATVFGSRALAKRVERFVLQRAEMVMPIRDSLRDYAMRFGARPDRVRVIPHGTELGAFVNPSDLDVRALFGIPARKKIVSFVGRLVRENYIDDIVALGRRLARERDDFTLLIVGGGLEQARIAALLQHDPLLRDSVQLAGFQPRSIVAAVRQASTVSLCLMGGFSLIEACASASPVVAYDVEWHRELIRDGHTGFLVVEHDLARLCDVVNRLLNDRALGTALGRAAQQLALSRHTLEATTAVKRQCYLQLLAARGASADPPH